MCSYREWGSSLTSYIPAYHWLPLVCFPVTNQILGQLASLAILPCFFLTGVSASLSSSINKPVLLFSSRHFQLPKTPRSWRLSLLPSLNYITAGPQVIYSTQLNFTLGIRCSYVPDINNAFPLKKEKENWKHRLSYRFRPHPLNFSTTGSAVAISFYTKKDRGVSPFSKKIDIYLSVPFLFFYPFKHPDRGLLVFLLLLLQYVYITTYCMYLYMSSWTRVPHV